MRGAHQVRQRRIGRKKSWLRQGALFGLTVIISVFIVAFGVRAWTNPSQNPPAGNVVPANVPSGLIGFFAGACPSGWTEYTSLQGRFIVGTPSAGTDAGTVGSALANLANRTISQIVSHSHSIDPPSTAASITDPGHNHTQNAHNHGVTDSGHNHTQNAHNHGVTDSGHTHPMPLGDGGSGSSIGAYPNQANNLGTQNTNSNTTGITINNTTPTNNSNTTGITINNTTPTNNSNTTGISGSVNIAAFDSAATGTASVDVTMPYIQLRACQKT